MATTLGAVAVGSSVYMNINGVRTEFLVVHQGLPSSLYDSSCDGTWLLMKDVYEQASQVSSNVYASSVLHEKLNETFFETIDADVRNHIKLAKIPYINGTGLNGTLASGANGLETRIFFLSVYEVGWTEATSSSGYFTTDGACLSYFNGTSTTDAKRIAYLDGTAVVWWLRSPRMTTGNRYAGVSEAGGTAGPVSNGNYGVRPALIMSTDMYVDNSGNLTTQDSPDSDESYTKLEYIQSSGSQYVNTNFYPKNNTTVVADYEPTVAATSTYFPIYGTISSAGNLYAMHGSTGYVLGWGTQEYYPLGTYQSGRTTVKVEDRTLYINGTAVKTATSETFTATYPLYIFAFINGGKVDSRITSMRLYSCQIYDNGTLVRDFVPAKRNSDGAIGLLDQANNVFYANAGTGTFTAGPEIANTNSAALIDDTNYPIAQGYVLIGDIEYPLIAHRVLVDDVLYEGAIGESVEVIAEYPSQSGTLIYTGNALSPTWNNYDPDQLTIGGTTSATNAGTYTATFTPKDGYAWDEAGDVSAKSVTWTIGKAAGKVTLSKTSISMNANGSTTFTVSRLGNGAISVKSSSTSKATVSLSGTTVTVKGVAAGSATITVSVAEGTNHLAASATCSVTVTAVTYTMTITGVTGSTSQQYVLYNGARYTSPTTFEIDSGDTVEVYAYIITLDGTTVQQGSSSTYKYTPKGNATFTFGTQKIVTTTVKKIDITTS